MEFYAKIQDGRKKRLENKFWEKLPVNFIALSCTVSEIFKILNFHHYKIHGV